MAVATDWKILRPDLPTSIDMASLSHSELLSLSLLSNPSSNDAVFSATDLHHSSFNESASTHKQTFSNSPFKRRRHLRGFSLFKQERSEFNLIVDFLKQYLEIQLGDSAPGERKVMSRRKRRRTKVLDEERRENGENVSVEIVNQNGVVVDLAALTVEREEQGGPYGEELRRRAAGMEREEELLGMLAEMKGEWCSRRKKRRVVEACLLGDALPVGWKLIIALRRKAGRFFPYCRRYVSPTGEQLASCKEVSSYLQSYFGINDASLLRDARGELCINSVESCSLVDFTNSTLPDSCTPIDPGKDVSALGIDNLPEVHVCDLYECLTCNVSFHEKDKYLQHLLSFHQMTTRSYRLGSSVEDSPVQMTDSAKLHCMDRSPNATGISPMDALIEAAQCSVQENSPCVPELEPLSVNNRDKPSKTFRVGVANFMTGNKSISCPSELEMEKKNGEVKTSSEKLNSCDKVSGISGDCPDKTEVAKDNGKDKASSVASIPTCEEISEILMVDGAINDLGACSIEFGEGIDQDKSSTKELSPCVKVTVISVADRNEVDSTFNELEMEKDSGQRNIVSAEMNPCNNINDNLMTNVETKKQVYTCSRVVSEKKTDIDPMTLPAAKSGHRAVNACESNTFSAKNEGSAIEHKLDAEQAQEDDDKEPANVSGVSHASGCTEPQKAMNSSSQFDEALGKAGQYMSVRDRNLESEIRTEYMELDDIEPHMHNTMNGGDSISLSEVSMDVENSTRAGAELPSSIESQSESQLGMAGKGLKTTFCVWCGIEFCHEVIDIELQPDSVGFMCPTCRNKISRQFNDLESNFSLDPHYC